MLNFFVFWVRAVDTRRIKEKIIARWPKRKTSFRSEKGQIRLFKGSKIKNFLSRVGPNHGRSLHFFSVCVDGPVTWVSYSLRQSICENKLTIERTTIHTHWSCNSQHIRTNRLNTLYLLKLTGFCYWTCEVLNKFEKRINRKVVHAMECKLIISLPYTGINTLPCVSVSFKLQKWLV